MPWGWDITLKTRLLSAVIEGSGVIVIDRLPPPPLSPIVNDLLFFFLGWGVFSVKNNHLFYSASCF